MSESRFDFCPRCGAVSRDGKCQSCGYVNEKVRREMEAAATADASDGVNPVCKKKKSGAVAAIVAIVLLLTFFSIVLLCTDELITEEYESYYGLFKELANVKSENLSGTSGTSLDNSGEQMTLLEFMWDQPVFFVYDSSEKMQEDDYDYYDRGTDCYYFDDYISKDVKYSVNKRKLGYSNDDNWMAEYGYEYANNLYMYGEFYELENTGLDNEKEINDFLYKMATYGPVFFENDKDCIDENDGYYTETYETITYMNDSTFSVLVEMYGYVVTDVNTDNEDYVPTSSTILSAVIDMNAGCTIQAEDLFEIDRNFTINFFEEANRQNGIDLYDKYSVDEVLSDFKNGDLLFVYTPLGAEFCYPYPDYSGYITYTCTDYLKYLKKD